MKKFIFFFSIVLFGLFLQTRCTKEKIVEKEKIIYRDTIIHQDSSKGLYLLEFITLPQTSTKSRVILNFIDLADAINTSYDNSLFNVNTATIHETNTLSVAKAVYDSVNVFDYYRSTTIARPNNDTIKVMFRIGTMGDVDIKVQ